MKESAHGGITVAIFFDPRRPDKNNRCPVKIRVRYKRDRKDYTTGKRLTVSEWEKVNDSNKKGAEVRKVRSELQASFNIVDSIVEDLYRENSFSFDVLSSRMSKGTTDTVNTHLIKKSKCLKTKAGSAANYIIPHLSRVFRHSAVTVSNLKTLL